MLEWAKANDPKAKQIARNARNFALEHISESNNLAYLHAALLKYQALIKQ